MKLQICSVLAFLLIAAPVCAQDSPMGLLTAIGVDQRLGEQVPMDVVFRDEWGTDVRIGDYFRGRPVVLSFVYYKCPMLCSMVLEGLLKSLRALPFDAGTDFEVVTVSFEPSDTPEIAREKKAGYAAQYGREGAAGWHFLTGDEASIRELTDAVGYRYQWDAYTNQWAHVSALMVLTPEGRLSQYLYGIEFSARDLRLSLVEASESRIGTIVDRVLLYCYSYDPASGRYGFVVMNALRIAGLGTVLALAIFIVSSVRRERRV